MIFNAKKFLEDFDIPCFTEGENCQHGWINVTCPFCEDPSCHGGFNLAEGYYNCWRCGGHFLDRTVMALADVKKSIAQEIIDDYSENIIDEKEEEVIVPAKMVTYPAGTGTLRKKHRRYLIKRHFDPDELESTWSLLGTREFGDYKNRIIAPIFHNNRVVSYQGRDITNTSPERYKACNRREEVIHHKKILYGSDFVQHSRMIVVEGITDAWRIGKGAVATFGTSYTKKQLGQMYELAKTIFILFDFDAQDKADELSYDLSLLGIDVERVFLESVKDPGSMKQKDASYLRQELLGY